MGLDSDRLSPGLNSSQAPLNLPLDSTLAHKDLNKPQCSFYQFKAAALGRLCCCCYPYREDLIFPVPSLGACYPLLIFDELHML